MPAIKPGGASVTLRGELESFNRRTDDGWGFGTLRVEGTDTPIKFTGKVLGAKPGDALEVQGQWVDHETFGRQFKVRSTVASAPATEDGVHKWLAATLPGVGAARAQALIEHFGSVDALWHAIEHEPGRLSEVSGITDAQAEKISKAYAEARGSRDHMIALRGWGLTDNQIERCLKQWKTLDHVVERIRQNPYQLSQHVNGFGFKRADEVAMLAGIAYNSPTRIEAGIVHTLETATGEGHCWIFGGALQRIASSEVLKVSPDEVARGIVRASKARQILRRGKRIYCARMEIAEGRAARAVSRLLGVFTAPAPANDNADTTVH